MDHSNDVKRLVDIVVRAAYKSWQKQGEVRSQLTDYREAIRAALLRVPNYLLNAVERDLCEGSPTGNRPLPFFNEAREEIDRAKAQSQAWPSQLYVIVMDDQRLPVTDANHNAYRFMRLPLGLPSGVIYSQAQEMIDEYMADAHMMLSSVASVAETPKPVGDSSFTRTDEP